MNNDNNLNLILIAGGTSSGKTTLANKITQHLPSKDVTLISLDNYYKDLTGISDKKLENYNFDIPESFDEDLLISDVKKIMQNKKIDKIIYDFKTHSRVIVKNDYIRPAKFIIIEGIYALYYKCLNELAFMKLYVDLDSDIRLLRRIVRDTNERDINFEELENQYLRNVKPMHDKFISRTKKHADFIINSENDMGNKIKLLLCLYTNFSSCN